MSKYLCRICADEGKYNIFNDELCFDVTKNNKLKIYIVLNNFLFEKLYSEDENSPAICHTCCNNLCDSYSFMIQVRESEQQQKLNNQKEKAQPKDLNCIVKSNDVQKSNIDEDQDIKQEPSIDELSELEDDFDNEVEDCVEIERVIEEPEPEPDDKPPKKKPKPLAELNCIPNSIIYSHHELGQYIENDQHVIVLNTSPHSLDRPLDGKSYEFDSTWIQHADSSFIYKCKYCIKAFFNAEFLLKHTISSHLCLLCLETSDNYKELTKHTKLHTDIVCKFCSKSCTTSSSYRQHLKKKHFPGLPHHIGILLQ